jgi:hypothetical protein
MMKDIKSVDNNVVFLLDSEMSKRSKMSKRSNMSKRS